MTKGPRKRLTPLTQKMLVHRLDQVAPLEVRHDIVHRGGKTKEGQTIDIGISPVSALRDNVTAFVHAQTGRAIPTKPLRSYRR